MAVSLMSLDMGCTLEAPLQQTRIDYFPDVGLLMIGTGDVDAVAHDTVLETYDGYLNMGALIIQQQRGMRASFHGDLTALVPHRAPWGRQGVRRPGGGRGGTDDGVKRQAFSCDMTGQLDAKANIGVPGEGPLAESLDGQDIERRLRFGCDHPREERHMLGGDWHAAGVPGGPV